MIPFDVLCCKRKHVWGSPLPHYRYLPVNRGEPYYTIESTIPANSSVTEALPLQSATARTTFNAVTRRRVCRCDCGVTGCRTVGTASTRSTVSHVSVAAVCVVGSGLRTRSWTSTYSRTSHSGVCGWGWRSPVVSELTTVVQRLTGVFSVESLMMAGAGCMTTAGALINLHVVCL